ncbi:helix-turn-helix transcriptional regulator [Nocardia sp. NPDC046763]|uniref:helix-turn-helix domain-containing protein n=1 Tax=Nocardia sp. NPDC046763 TaxID=3155256 RepID=UPI0033CDE167
MNDPASEPGQQSRVIADQLAREIARLRLATGLSQRKLAAKIGYSRQYVSMAEWEDSILPSPELVAAIDTGLDANGALVAIRAQAGTAQARRRAIKSTRSTDTQAGHSTAARGGPVAAGNALDDPIAVLERVHQLSRLIDPEIVRSLQLNTVATVEDYESLDHSRVVPLLTKQRAWIDELTDQCSHPHQRQQLYEVAAETSGLLGYIAVGRGDFPLARAYCVEAFTLGDSANDANLRAWARGLQSFCEYYAGQFTDALRYAEDGVAQAQSGPQSARILINGVARARGQTRRCRGRHARRGRRVRHAGSP